MVVRERAGILAKIAAGVDTALAERAAIGSAGQTRARRIAGAADWNVADVLCTSAPGDRPFEEEHTYVSVAMVVAGTFQYRSPLGRAELTPGSLLLGNAGDCFECGHQHAPGDRCIAFRYAPDFIERLLPELGLRRVTGRFRAARVPPSPASAALIARASAGIAGGVEVCWEELAIDVAALALGYRADASDGATIVSPSAAARVTESVRAIQRDAAARLDLKELAGQAGLSPYHYLRTFRHVTGVTPHQFILRTRLREAASRLLAEDAKVIDVAFSSGFGDLANFNRAFRAEFGFTPRAFRLRYGRTAAGGVSRAARRPVQSVTAAEATLG